MKYCAGITSHFRRAKGARRTERRHVAGLHGPDGLCRQHADAPARPFRGGAAILTMGQGPRSNSANSRRICGLVCAGTNSHFRPPSYFPATSPRSPVRPAAPTSHGNPVEPKNGTFDQPQRTQRAHRKELVMVPNQRTEPPAGCWKTDVIHA